MVDALPSVCIFSLADALLPWSCCSVTASPQFHAWCLLSLDIFSNSLSSIQVQLFGWPLFGWRVWGVLPLLLAAIFIIVVFSRLCVFLQYFSFISPLCSCVGQALFDRVKIVYITAFFLMKNMFKHGCEKNIAKAR